MEEKLLWEVINSGRGKTKKWLRSKLERKRG
jgi:hypothetical protein